MKMLRDVDEYIAGFSPAKQKILKEFRKAVRKGAPGAEEVLSYGMPAYKQKGIVVYFAMHTNHLGFYPLITAIKAFGNELKGYEMSKGTVRFPLDKPIPYSLITEIVEFRIKENLAKVEAKKRK